MPFSSPGREASHEEMEGSGSILEKTHTTRKGPATPRTARSLPGAGALGDGSADSPTGSMGERRSAAIRATIPDSPRRISFGPAPPAPMAARSRREGRTAAPVGQPGPGRAPPCTATSRGGGAIVMTGPGRPQARSPRPWARGLRPRAVLATRNPTLLFRFPVSFLLRFADRRFLGLLFHEPPRNTRRGPIRLPGYRIGGADG